MHGHRPSLWLPWSKEQESHCLQWGHLEVLSQLSQTSTVQPGSHPHSLPHATLRSLTCTLKLRKFLPTWLIFSSTLSVSAWPEREVPAALKVTGTPCFLATGSRRRISSSECTWTTHPRKCHNLDRPKNGLHSTMNDMPCIKANDAESQRGGLPRSLEQASQLAYLP